MDSCGECIDVNKILCLLHKREESLSDLSKVAQLIGGRARLQTQGFGSFNHYPIQSS